MVLGVRECFFLGYWNAFFVGKVMFFGGYGNGFHNIVILQFFALKMPHPEKIQ